MSSGFDEAPPTPLEAKPHFLGHRQRLRDRFTKSGAASLADYELLELLLFRAIARADTKPMAKALITRFGTFAEVLSAPAERLLEVKGVGEAIANDIKLIQAAALRLMQAEVKKRPLLDSWTSVLDYIRAAMAFNEREQFRLLFLDKKHGLIADEVQQEGTVDHTPAYVREVVKRALDLASSGIILVHNHPSGDPTPSIADIDLTRRIVDATSKLGIAVIDHVIIGRKGHTSFKGSKII